MPEKLESFAKDIREQILAKIDNKDQYGVDPLTIILIIGIIVNIIRVIQECNKKEANQLQVSEKAELLYTDVRFRAMHSSFFSRWRLRSIIGSHLNYKQNKKYGEAILKTLLEAGKGITKEEVLMIMEYGNV